jgi:DNA-directed RNA polymerase subunit K/omega
MRHKHIFPFIYTMSTIRIKSDVVDSVISIGDFSSTYDPKHNTTSPKLSRYEMTLVKGTRLQQLYLGAQTCLDDKEKVTSMSMEAIMEAEFKEKCIPFIIERTLPNDTKETWRFCDMIC